MWLFRAVTVNVYHNKSRLGLYIRVPRIMEMTAHCELVQRTRHYVTCKHGELQAQKEILVVITMEIKKRTKANTISFVLPFLRFVLSCKFESFLLSCYHVTLIQTAVRAPEENHLMITARRFSHRVHGALRSSFFFSSLSFCLYFSVSQT